MTLEQKIKDLKELFKNDSMVEIARLPDKYPQGGEKVLIYNTTHRIVPEGKLPADVGVIVINVTSLTVLAKYIENIEKLYHVAQNGNVLQERVEVADEEIEKLKSLPLENDKIENILYRNAKKLHKL
mgnify:CR=1 FL=1